jgi:uncharacterized protein YndB with AHSA1/START domain
MTEMTLPYSMDRRVVIAAPRDLVFRYFTDSERWARWWGKGSTIDPRPQGEVNITHANGVQMAGQVVEIDPPARIVFTYGYRSGTPIAAGGSLVTIRLDEHAEGTELNLSHAFADAARRDEHVQGWRYQLSLFGNVTTNEARANASEAVDAWFGAWSEPDQAARESVLDRIAATDVQLRDQFSLIHGMDDLRPHLAAVHTFMSGVRLTREGGVRHCQGVVLADWVMRGADGQERGRGTNVFVFGPAGDIRSVAGFVSSAADA